MFDMIDIDFWQHLLLATWLFLMIGRWLNKKYTMMIVMSIGMGYEFFYDYLFNLSSYQNLQHFLKDSLMDLGAALIACVFCIMVIKDTK